MSVCTYALTLEDGQDDRPAWLEIHAITPGDANVVRNSSSLIGGHILAVSGDPDDIMRYVLSNGLDNLNFFYHGGLDVIIEPRLYEERDARILKRENAKSAHDVTS